MASIRFNIPNVNKFFEGLISLLQQCGDCMNENTDGGHAECLARRLAEYQRTLPGDVWSSYGVGQGLLQQNQLTQDLELLIRMMNSRLQSPATLNSDFHYEGNTELTEESSTTQNSKWSN